MTEFRSFTANVKVKGWLGGAGPTLTQDSGGVVLSGSNSTLAVGCGAQVAKPTRASKSASFLNKVVKVEAQFPESTQRMHQRRPVRGHKNTPSRRGGYLTESIVASIGRKASTTTAAHEDRLRQGEELN